MSFPRPSRPVWLLVALFALSLPAVTTRIYASDEVQYHSFLRSLWFDHDLAFENEYRYFYDSGIVRNPGFHETLLERETEAGQRINFGTIGCAILWAPFYAVGDLPRARCTPLGRDVAVDGYSKPYIAAVCYGSAVYGFLALLLSIAAARRLGLDATASTAAIWFGTPLLFYMYVAPPMAHACSAFAVALLVTIWLRVRTTWSVPGVVALGAVTALTGMVREQDVLLACGPALDCLSWALGMDARNESAARHPRAGPARARRGRDVRHRVHPTGRGLHRAERSPRAVDARDAQDDLDGAAWAPGPALTRARLPRVDAARDPRDCRARLDGLSRRHDAPVESRTLRRVAACMLLMIALQVYSAGSVESWTVAGAFGQRRFVAITSLLVIGLAGLQHRLSSASIRPLLHVVTAVAIYWNLALMAEFATGLMDRQRLEPARNAYDAFVTVPRMAPDLAYRYLFNRASFYKTGLPQ